MQLENELVMGKRVYTDYKKEFVKIGNTVTIRKPVKFVASDGATRVNQDVSESSTSIVINKRKHVSWTFSMEDLTLSVEKYSERYIQPAMSALANQVDYDLLGLYKDVPMAVGAAGTTPNAFSIFGGAAQKLDEQCVPQSGRSVVWDPAAQWSMADQFDTLVYNEKITEAAIRKGYIGRMADFEMYMDQNVRKHTMGTAEDSGTVTVSGASQTGSSVTLANGSAETMLAGDIFTMAGCYDVNPKTGEAYSHLKQFVVTTSGTFSTTLAVPIYPSIITSGAYKTCDASPTNGGAVVFAGSAAAASRENLAFHKNAFALVFVPIELPQSAGFKARETHNNMSVRVVKDYNVDTDDEVIRLDIMYGIKTIYPELACRILG